VRAISQHTKKGRREEGGVRNLNKRTQGLSLVVLKGPLYLGAWGTPIWEAGKPEWLLEKRLKGGRSGSNRFEL